MSYLSRLLLATLCLVIALNSIAQPNITRAEYFIDNDPGVGLGTPVSITPSPNLTDVPVSFDPTGLSTGVHYFYLRTQDANGAWSHTAKWVFANPFAGFPQLPAENSPLSPIVQAEYFIDVDPGLGLAIPVPVTSSTNLTDIPVSFDPTPLSTGVHYFYLRTRAANGAWSHTARWVFAKPFAGLPALPADSTPLSPLVKAEYFIDNDPGIGSGVPVALNPSINIADQLVDINAGNVSTGTHNLYIRTFDSSGKSSHTAKLVFAVPASVTGSSIVVNNVTDTVLCAADSFDISYHVTGTYNTGNVFNVQLSDAAGSFAGTPIVIGSYAGTGNSIIKAKLPAHISDGDNYRVRVVSSDPGVTGITDNSTLTIHDRPNAQTITGAGDVNATFTYPYSVPAATGSTWQWIAPAATITPTANSANLLWNTVGQQQLLKVIETNQYGCVGDTSMKNVNVYPLKITNVTPSTLTPCPDGVITVAAYAFGVYYSGNTFTAQLSNATGSFATPVTIGTLTPAPQPVGNAQPISINARIPYPLANGTNYRIRVVSSNYSKISDTSAAIAVNKPSLGADQERIKCAGLPVDLTTVFTTTGLTTLWNVTNPQSVFTPGVYQLIVTNANGCKDTANVTITDNPKPNLGNDTTVYIICQGESVSLTSLYTTTGLTVQWNTGTPGNVGAGNYQLIVTNTQGCKDTANVIVRQDVATWTGALNSNWHTAGNWSTGRVPGSKTHVIIPAASPACIISTADGIVASIQVRSGATFTVGVDRVLNITSNCNPLPD